MRTSRLKEFGSFQTPNRKNELIERLNQPGTKPKDMISRGKRLKPIKKVKCHSNAKNPNQNKAPQINKQLNSGKYATSQLEMMSNIV